jgi:hypothetical protein
MNKRSILILGDALAIALLTIIGFATHGAVEAAFLPRMAAAFFPVLFSWFVLAPRFGLFDEQVAADPKLLWRVPLAMLFAAPLAAILRSAILGSLAVPLFALVLGVSNALGMIVWRWAYVFIAKRG